MLHQFRAADVGHLECLGTIDSQEGLGLAPLSLLSFKIAIPRRGRHRARPNTSISNRPWSMAELGRLLASARSMLGTIGAASAGQWWEAFLLVLLGTGCEIEKLIRALPAAFDRRSGTLSLGDQVYDLHPLALFALASLVPETEAGPTLFPRNGLRGGDPGFFLPFLRRNFRKLLWRVNLSTHKSALFNRVRKTARSVPNILDRVDMHVACELRRDPPRFAGPRARRRAARGRRREKQRRKRAALRAAAVRQQAAYARRTVRHPNTGRRRRAPGQGPIHDDPRPEVLLIANGSPRSLRRVFREEYHPRRLAAAREDSAQDYEIAIEHLSWFCACEVTLDQLSDGLIERFMGFLVKSGRSASTANGQAGCIYTLWRFAFAERLLDDLPRKRHKLPLMKRLPEAWSIDEFGRLLRAAEETRGWIGDVPAATFWPAFLLTLYDTGLRVAAALALPTSALDAYGWLTAPAHCQKQRAEQSFRLHPQTLRALSELALAGDKLFPVPWLHPKPRLNMRLREILIGAGLPHGKRDLFHRIRRTTASYIADAAGDEMAQRQLGHSSVNLTRSNYIDPRKVHRRIELADLIQRPQWKSARADQQNDAGEQKAAQ